MESSNTSSWCRVFFWLPRPKTCGSFTECLPKSDFKPVSWQSFVILYGSAFISPYFLHNDMIIKHESDDRKMFPFQSVLCHDLSLVMWDYEVKRGTFGISKRKSFTSRNSSMPVIMLSFLNHVTLRWMIRIFLETHARTSLDFAVPGVLGLDLFGLDVLGRVSAPKTWTFRRHATCALKYCSQS